MTQPHVVLFTDQDDDELPEDWDVYVDTPLPPALPTARIQVTEDGRILIGQGHSTIELVTARETAELLTLLHMAAERQATLRSEQS